MHPTEQVIATQMAIFGERLSRQYQNVLAMAMDSSIDASDRLAAHELATDMAYALANMASKVPAIVARQMPVDLTRRISKVPAYLPSSPQQQQPPKLIEVKPVKETDLNNNNNE
jgi:hypothetical protein